MSGLLFEEESFAIRGACFEVYREMGCGYLESVYQECMEIELELSNVPFLAKPALALDYKRKRLRTHFEPDFVCCGKIILEIKAVTNLCDDHRAQLHNYLKTTGYRLDGPCDVLLRRVR